MWFPAFLATGLHGYTFLFQQRLRSKDPILRTNQFPIYLEESLLFSKIPQSQAKPFAGSGLAYGAVLG